MSNRNVRPSARATIAGTISPDAHTSGTKTSGYVDMGRYESLQALIQTGTLGASATVDGKLVQATDDQGAGKKDIAGKAIAQMVKANDDDSQAVIEMRSEDVDINAGFRFVALEMVIGTATSDAGAVLLGMDARYQPEPAATSVKQVVG